MKPIINKIPVFDAAKGIEVTFKTDTQIMSFDVEIYDENDTELIYSNVGNINKQNKFVIPPNVLTNNRIYIIYLSITEAINQDGWHKIFVSDPQQIKCVPTPSFSLNIDYNTQYTLRSSFLDVGIKYTDNASKGFEEQLNEYFITATDTNGNKIYRSDLIYNIDDNVGIVNLTNGNTYIVTGHGTTIGGMKLETNPVTVNVNYEECKDSSVLSAYNDRKNGCIRLESKIDGVVYDIDNEPSFSPQFDLTGNRLRYNQGLTIDGDFSLLLKYRPTIYNVCFLKLNNGEIRINYRLTDNNVPYFEVITKDKSVIVNKNSDGNAFSSIGNLEEINSYGYTIQLSRKNNQIYTKIKEWRK